MADAAVAADIHEAFEVHLGFRPERPFHLVIGGDDATDLRDLVIIQIGDLLVKINAGLRQNVARRRPPDPENIRQADFGALFLRQINTRYTSQPDSSFLTLTLFVFRILADDPDDTFPPDDLAVVADLLHR
jgi:hypothetical protein